MKNKKRPLTIIQEAIKEDEIERLPKKMANYTLIIVICAIINVVSIIFSLSKEENSLPVEQAIPTDISENIENMQNKIFVLQERISSLKSKRIFIEDLKKGFDKQASVSIELIIARLSEIDKEIHLVENDVMGVWKKVVSIQKKQIQIKNQVRENQ